MEEQQTFCDHGFGGSAGNCCGPDMGHSGPCKPAPSNMIQVGKIESPRFGIDAFETLYQCPECKKIVLQ